MGSFSPYRVHYTSPEQWGKINRKVTLNMSTETRRVLVAGGAGYVGSRLAPQLIGAGFQVRVLDMCWYGKPKINSLKEDSPFSLVVGDIREPGLVSRALEGVTDVIHLACISNDPSYDLDPGLGKSINLDSFSPFVKLARDSGVGRFIYASSSSVYGVKKEERVTEELKLEPLTDYSRYKAECEEILFAERGAGFVVTALRPATLCGPAPRQRMDLTVNLMTNHAFNSGAIRVFGGSQHRPNLHIDDMCDAYVKMLEQAPESIDGEVFNVGAENLSVLEIAEKVKAIAGGDTQLIIEPTQDQRSYRISSQRISEKLGFRPRKTVEDAILDLFAWHREGRFPNSMKDSRYFNIARMQEILSQNPLT